MNKVHRYRDLEREYVTSQVSIRELCRRHGISAHSLVTVQARKGKWAEKREQYQAKASDAYLERYAARHADREAEVRAIDEAITRFRDDLKETEKKLVGGEWIEVPVMRLTPRDLAVLIDRLNPLFARPNSIREERRLNLNVAALPAETLRRVVEMTRGLTESQTAQESPLPRRPEV